MATRTLLELRTRAKQRAKMENSQFLTDSEWNANINYAISELRDIIISKVGDDYFAEEEPITLVSGQDTYALPADFYKALWLQATVSNITKKLSRFEISEMESQDAFPLSEFPRYRLRADTVWFTPNRSVQSVSLWYVPLAQELSADGDTLQGFNGWDEYIVLHSAITALDEEEQDTNKLELKLEKLRLRIEAAAANRDQAQPMRIQDSERVEVGQWL